MAVAALALAVSAGAQSVQAAPTNNTGQTIGIVTTLAHGSPDGDHRDNRDDRSTNGMASCKAICAPMFMVLSPAPAVVPSVPRPAIGHPVAAAFLDGLTNTPDPPPPRPPAID